MVCIMRRVESQALSALIPLRGITDCAVRIEQPVTLALSGTAVPSVGLGLVPRPNLNAKLLLIRLWYW